ncbi:ProC Pyrroline-5-carboxylate reductase [Candidatus Nanopelagicaceae bacterium]
MANQVAVVGAGVMGEAFIAALIRSGVPATSIIAVVRRSERGDELVAKYGISVKPLDEALRTSDVVMLGIKPQGLADLMPEIAPHLRPDALVISLLAGKTIAGISAGLNNHSSIARVMPNTPTLIGKGMAGYSLSAGVTDAQKKFVQSLLTATGKAIEIPEDLQNALTGTSGSGPAYFFRFVEAMVDGSVAMGLSREDATTLTIQTIVGAAALLDESGDTPTRLREKVTSLKGATAEALAVFDEAGISKIVADAMAASARRAGELAQ